MTNKPCSENYVLEPSKGVLQYCPHNEHAEWVAEGLRAIAGLRTTTTVLVQNACSNHSNQSSADAVQRWIDASKRYKEEQAKKIVQFPRHHVMGDGLEGCFDELNN